MRPREKIINDHRKCQNGFHVKPLKGHWLTPMPPLISPALSGLCNAFLYIALCTAAILGQSRMDFKAQQSAHTSLQSSIVCVPL